MKGYNNNMQTKLQYIMEHAAMANIRSIRQLSKKTGITANTFHNMKTRPVRDMTLYTIKNVLPTIDVQYLKSLPNEKDIAEMEKGALTNEK